MNNLDAVDTRGATHVAAFVVVDGLILIQRRAPERRFLPEAWDVIGGAVERPESLVDAVVREVYEECGLRVAEMGEWITRTEFVDGARECVEVGALVWPAPGKFVLEAGKASALALVEDVEAFADDNRNRGYPPLLHGTVGRALEVLHADEV